MISNMVYGIGCIFCLLSLGKGISSRIIEQWPVLSEGKRQGDHIFNFESVGINDRDWNHFYGYPDEDIKPVKEVQAIILTKNLPVPFPGDGHHYPAYSPEENFPFQMTVDKEVGFPVKKILPIPIEEGSLFSPGGQSSNSRSHPHHHHHHHPQPYLVKYLRLPVPHPLPHTPLHGVEQKIPVPYPVERSLPFHHKIPYSFSIIPVDEPLEGNKKIFLEKNTPYVSIFLVPFPVDKSSIRASQNQETNDRSDSQDHMNPKYYTNLKPQDARSQLYSVTHKLYNSHKEETKPPQVVDYNHPIDRDEE